MISGIEIGKCTEQWGVKIPESLKRCMDSLTQQQKTDLKAELLIVMAKACHSASFDPCKYLTD